MFTFDPLVLLMWIAVICFIPGCLISFSILRKQAFSKLEKLFIGFGLGIIIAPLIPFLFYFLLGVEYSYTIALLTAILLYIIGIILVFWSRLYEELKIPQLKQDEFKLSFENMLPIFLSIIILLSFILRFLSYTPIYQELDPYYYTYISQQILVLGHNPVNDQTAWYPDEVVSHRAVPALAYLESLWYSFYTGGNGQYDNILLAAIASIYPPLLAALSIFFLYLFISITCKKEWGVLSAGVVAFLPIFVFKTSAGVMEVQTYAFFSIAFFLSMYAMMLKEKNMLYAILAGIAYLAVSLGSSSELLVLTFLLLFIPLQSIFIFFTKEDNAELKLFITNNAVIFAIGALIGSSIIKGFFYNGSLGITYTLAFFMMLAFSGVLYIIREKFSDKAMQRNIFLLILLCGIVAFFFTPIGDLIKSIAISGVGFAKFNAPLDHTIAEQNLAGSDLSGSFGFISLNFPSGLDVLLVPFSVAVNLGFALATMFLNFVLGTNVSFDPKANNLLLFWIALFAGSIVYSLYRALTKEDNNVFAILFIALVFPPLFIGLIKAKYMIYAGFFMAAAIAFVFNEIGIMLPKLLPAMEKEIFYVLIAMSLILIFGQFAMSSQGFAPAVLSSISKQRFQDNPAAFTAKFQTMCTQLSAQGISEESLCTQYRNSGLPLCNNYDSPICEIASDPVAYANKGTNEQFSTKLCYYSLISDITNPKNEEFTSASFRCSRVTSYWIEAMEWIKTNTESESRTTSWWDYGHWINYFGQKNTVLRNEHVSRFMIGEVAHDYLDGTPEELALFMRSRNSSYALFDMELISSGSSLGGKYGALNYLSCARDNLTNVSFQPGMSMCEADHLWETIYIPNDATGRGCTISTSGNKSGVLAYHAYWTWSQTIPMRQSATYPSLLGINCLGSYLNDPQTLAVCQQYISMKPAYCVGDITYADNNLGYGTYLLNETYPNGDLKLNKAILGLPNSYSQTYHLGDVTEATLFYTNDKVFMENGQFVSGFNDQRTKFYSSNLYRAMFLDEIPGFTKVFETKDGMVKIYKLNG